ncbi:MAG: hypothetical protein ACRD0O_14740 [Acidimicrobiia bacterium]
MDLKKLSLGERIIGAAGLFLMLDLLFLPWHRVSFSIPGIARITESRSALQAPNGFLGLLAFLVVVALVARLVISQFTKIELPEIPVSWGRADLLGAAGVAALLLLKLVMETNSLSVGAWLAILGAGALVYGGFLRDREMRAVSPL